MAISSVVLMQLLDDETGASVREDFLSRSTVPNLDKILLVGHDCFYEDRVNTSFLASFAIFGRCPFYQLDIGYLESVVFVLESLKSLYPERKIYYYPDWFDPEELTEFFDNTDAVFEAINLMKQGDCQQAQDLVYSSLRQKPTTEP